MAVAGSYAGLTELQDDEAYYWVFSRFPDWGYFDHPPMIAVLVKMGYSIFPNELGVQLFPLLLNVFSLLIIERLIDRKNTKLFYAIALSMAVIQLTGFIAVPDIPLIFFTALFFLCYKNFLRAASITNTIVLGVAMALLLYSKYHAVLIILFVLLSNLHLFKKYQLYIAGIIGIALFLPHLYWQYQHDWVSFRYHLFESNVNAYKPSFTISYLLGQILLPGPIAGFIILPAAFMYRPSKSNESYWLERSLQFTMIGVYAFFLLSSFRGKVEANWTSPVLVPLIVLSHQFLIVRAGWQKMLLKLLPVTVVLVLMARVIMIEDIIPVKGIRDRYHAWKNWPKEMKEKTKGLPVVFSNSYQRASKYWFYTGQVTYSQNLYRGRRNNYNFWPIEDSMLGKPVYLLDKYDMWRFPDSMKTPVGWIGYRYDSSLVSLAKVQMRLLTKPLIFHQTSRLTVIEGVTDWPPLYRSYINGRLQNLPEIKLFIAVFNKRGWIKDYPASITIKDLLADRFYLTFPELDLPKGNYYLRFAISSGYYYPTHNSDKIAFKVE